MYRYLIVSVMLMAFHASANGQKWELVWSDEFNNRSGLPDTSKWTFEYGDGCPDVCGWGNNELQYYTRSRLDNARVEKGRLIIEAHQEDYSGKKFTSSRLITKQHANWKYGKIEARARMPQGKGTWPAIWMLPRDWKYGGWPKSGEIDIMEHVGYAQDSLFGTVHTEAYNHSKGTQKGKTVKTELMSVQFHTYSIEWTPEKIDFFVDGSNYFTYANEHTGSDSWPFDQYFYIILNLAVGGNFGGARGLEKDIWPQRMEVDYIRVYQKI